MSARYLLALAKLRIVLAPKPGPREKARLKLKSIKPADIVQCNRCGGREFIETKTGVMFKDAKTVGGFKNLICLCCLLNGAREQA